MIQFDEKHADVITIGERLSIRSINEFEDITLKASFMVLSNLNCEGRVTALFDLIVVGDIRARDLDVKGRLICLGNCTVDGSIVVQNDIWAEDIRTKSIYCHDRVFAQSIDTDTLSAEGNIIIGTTLAIEKKAETDHSVICGETAFGSGKIVASTIISSDPIDLYEGEEALEKPNQYKPQKISELPSWTSTNTDFFLAQNDYKGLLTELMLVPNEAIRERYTRYLEVLDTMSNHYPEKISELKDITLLIWMIEIVNDDLFKNWDTMFEWTEKLKEHFLNMFKGTGTGTKIPEPAKELHKGYLVHHSKYGEGEVTDVINTDGNLSKSRLAIIEFEKYGRKKFPIPESLKYFAVLPEVEAGDTSKKRIECSVNSYSEWIKALDLVSEHEEYLGTELYTLINERLLSILGLKTKYIEDRIKEKGWN